MIYFYRVINGPLKSVLHVLRNNFFRVILENKKKLRTLILCSHMKLLVAKLLDNHGTTITYNSHVFLSKSIKKINYHNIIRWGDSQIIAVSFSLLWEKKFILCCCKAYLKESRPQLFCNLINISHKHGAEQSNSWAKQCDYWLTSILRRLINLF